MATQTPLVYKKVALTIDDNEISNREINPIPIEVISKEQQNINSLEGKVIVSGQT